MNERLRKLGLITKELVPGGEYQSDEELGSSSATKRGPPCLVSNKIGADKRPVAVLDSRFPCAGTGDTRSGASVFPRIPGYFIVRRVYMISEKATDVIIEDAEQSARAGGQSRRVS